jgi:protein-disulfide isomerase
MEEERALTKREKRALAKENKRKTRQNKEAINRFKNWFIGLLVLIGLLFGGYKIWQFINTPTIPPEELLVINDNDHAKGNPDASVTLIEYADFECPACAVYSQETKRLAEEFSDEIQYVFRHFPLPTHSSSFEAAKATEAAGEQDMFWEMHDMLFERQSDWMEEGNPLGKFVEYASDLGLDGDKFLDDYESDVVKEKVSSDLTSANQLRLNQTPSFFLDGEKIQNPKGYDEFKSMIESAISSY